MGSRIKPGDVLLDKYRVERLLGEGGMAIVVAARHLQLDQTVAIKTMSSRALRFSDAVERFVREAQTAVRLSSENVARVHDVGTLDSGVPYMIMEHLEGVDLATVLEQQGVLAVEDAVDFILQACAAMHEAHAEGIVHRDLKPSNLFLTQRSNGSALIKVLDFGISKVVTEADSDQSLTSEFGTMGSPPYMSPEQARSAKNVDARTDIWSLGVLLYQLTTGELPFYADNAAEILAKVMYEEPASANDVAPWLSKRLANVIARCLDKDVDARFQSVEELAVALVRHASLEGRLRHEQIFVPNRRRRSSARVPSFGDEDTEVESSIIVDAPTPLVLSEFLERVPAVTPQVRSFGTTQAASGELAGITGARRSRARLVVAGLGLLVLGIAVAAIVAFTGSKDSRLQGEPTPATRPSAGAPDSGSDTQKIGQGDKGKGAMDGASDSAASVDAGAAPSEGTAGKATSKTSRRKKSDRSKSARKRDRKKSDRQKSDRQKSDRQKSDRQKSDRKKPDPFGTMD